MPDAPDQWAQADEDGPRVHPLFAHELGTLLAEWALARAEADYEPRGVTEQDDAGLYIRDQLELLGWKVDPSRQRRMHLTATPPPPPLPPL